MATEPPLHVLVDLGQASADLFHLVLVDDLWTRAPALQERVDERGREAIFGLGRRLDDQLASAERHVATMRGFFQDYGAWADERLRDDGITRLPAESQAVARRIMNVEEDAYAASAAALAGRLADRLPTERATVREKTEAMRGAGPLATDISQETLCGIVAIATMGSLLLCPKTGLGCVAAFAGGAVLVEYCS